MANWWEAGGASGVVAAYEPIGAPDLASSYLDRSGNGSDAAPGVAPTFDTAVGQIYNGTTQYLTTTIAPDVTASAWSAFVRVSGVSGGANNYVIGATDTGPAPDLRFEIINRPGSTQLFFGNGANVQNVGGAVAAGVLGFAGTALYKNGVLVGTFTQGVGGANTRPQRLYIGARSFDGTAALGFMTGNVQAIAIYNGDLIAGKSAAEINALALAISTAMAALPDGGSWGASPARLLNHLRRMRSR